MCLYLAPLTTYTASNIGVTLKLVRGRSRSLQMAPIDDSCTTMLLVCHCNYSSILHHFRVI